MILYLSSFMHTNGLPFPYTLAVNESGIGTGDGTEIVKLLIDDLWGARQALLFAAGISPDGVSEAPGTSQLLEAIRKISGSPGEGVVWWKREDPAITGDRVLLLNGQGILRANYPELDSAVYCGDSNNPTASAFYHSNNSEGTERSITGDYLIFPDLRGYTLRGLDLSASVDPEGSTRDIGNKQGFAIEKIEGSFGFVGNAYGGYISYGASGAFDYHHSPVGSASDLLVRNASGTSYGNTISFNTLGVVESSSETRMANVACRFGIRY